MTRLSNYASYTPRCPNPNRTLFLLVLQHSRIPGSESWLARCLGKRSLVLKFFLSILTVYHSDEASRMVYVCPNFGNLRPFLRQQTYIVDIHRGRIRFDILRIDGDSGACSLKPPLMREGVNTKCSIGENKRVLGFHCPKHNNNNFFARHGYVGRRNMFNAAPRSGLLY